MLLRDYTLRIVLSDCNPSSQKVNAIAELPVDISEILPYLNSVLKGLQYNGEERILTVKRKGHLISFRPREISITKLEDEDEAKMAVEELKQIINDTYTRREQIKPAYTSRPIPRPLDIFNLLPGTNCKKCGEPACLAFAVKLAGQEVGVLKCSPLFADKYQEKRKVLFEFLHAAGYDVPNISPVTEKRHEG